LSGKYGPAPAGEPTAAMSSISIAIDFYQDILNKNVDGFNGCC
jgi:hypothetical protein